MDERQPSITQLAKTLLQTFSRISSPKAAHQRVIFLRRAEIIVVTGNRCYNAKWTQEWLKTTDHRILVAHLHRVFRFIGEMIAELRIPRSTQQLLTVANARYRLQWDGNTQLSNRRGWLQSAELVRVVRSGKLVATEAGRNFADRLELYEPPSYSKEERPSPPELSHVAQRRAGGLSVPPVAAGCDLNVSTAGERARVQPNTSPTAEVLAVEIVEASTHSTEPDRFEVAVRDAFDFLGFEAQRLGGAGKTDVLLVAPLGKDDSYRVSVDAKSVGSGSLGDHQADWTALQDHRRLHQADYSLLVGPRPAQGRLMRRAESYGVAVMSAGQLTRLCRRHVKLPLGLADYRVLFAGQNKQGLWAPRGGNTAISDLDEPMENALRMRHLTEAILNVLSERSMTVGALRARDLWLMMLERGDLAEVSSEDEIQDLLDVLGHPLVRAVDGDAENGYVLSSKPAVTRMRLEHLAAAIAPESDS